MFLTDDAVQLSRKVRQQRMGKSTVVDSRRGRRGPPRTVRSNAADSEEGFPPGDHADRLCRKATYGFVIQTSV
jgi:hypothetical protein